jgi:hypothetical protein
VSAAAGTAAQHTCPSAAETCVCSAQLASHDHLLAVPYPAAEASTATLSTVCRAHAQIAGDKLTQLAAQHWSEAAQAKPDRPAFSPEIVQQIYKQELGGGNSKPPLMKRVMLLEVRGLLWCNACIATALIRHHSSLSTAELPTSTYYRSQCIATAVAAAGMARGHLCQEREGGGGRDGGCGWGRATQRRQTGGMSAASNSQHKSVGMHDAVN